MRVRREANLPKDKEFPRLTNKLDDCEFGEIAQVDFGQYTSLL
jgi:hypothetical protein